MLSTSFDVFYVDKGLNAFSDLLTTFGLAKVISSVLYTPTDNQFRLTLQDKGMYYELRCSPPIDAAMLAQRITPEKPIRTLKTSLPEAVSAYDYEAEKAQVNDYFAARRQNVEATPPGPYWDVLRAINPAALPGYNALMVAWHRVSDQEEVKQLLFDLFSSTPNDLDTAVERWKLLNKAHGWGIEAQSTAMQLYNPDSGKGQNRAKSNGLSVGNVDNFWLVEWLKAVGFYQGAVTRLVRGAKDRKTFVVAPRDLTYQEHNVVMREFISTMQVAESSTRFDILAVVRYMKALLNYLLPPDSRLTRLLKTGNIKKKVVGGFYTAFYKDMGNAIATMNMSFLALPGWITVETREQLTLYLDLLEELEKFVRQFDESHSDAFSLLQHLRDFVSSDDLRPFFRFTSAFPTYYMKMVQQRKYAVRLSTKFIERLIMSSSEDLSPILNDEGFQEIAYAIRKSTVIAQVLTQTEKRAGRTFPYDVRYGLNQDLIRKSAYGREFIQTLANFIISYNAENARVLELMMKRNVQIPFRNQRKNIKTSSIDSIVNLMARYDAKTVAMMLIAYGYAREPRDPQEETDLSENDMNQDMETEQHG